VENLTIDSNIIFFGTTAKAEQNYSALSLTLAVGTLTLIKPSTDEKILCKIFFVGTVTSRFSS